MYTQKIFVAEEVIVDVDFASHIMDKQGYINFLLFVIKLIFCKQ